MGSSSTSSLMQQAKSYTEESNFGNGTTIGTSLFQKSNNQIANTGNQNISAAMSKAKQAYTQSMKSYAGSSLDIVA